MWVVVMRILYGPPLGFGSLEIFPSGNFILYESVA